MTRRDDTVFDNATINLVNDLYQKVFNTSNLRINLARSTSSVVTEEIFSVDYLLKQVNNNNNIYKISYKHFFTGYLENLFYASTAGQGEILNNRRTFKESFWQIRSRPVFKITLLRNSKELLSKILLFCLITCSEICC